MAARWYVIHVYSGSEKKVAESLREQAVLKNMEDKILEVMVPTENIVEVKKGAKVNSERKFFPGYVLVKMEMSDDAWMVIKNTPSRPLPQRQDSSIPRWQKKWWITAIPYPLQPSHIQAIL